MGKKSAKTRSAGAAAAPAGLGIGLSAPNVQTITCADGTTLPVGKPSHISDEEYAKVLEFLKANPAQAKQAVAQVQGAMQRDPQMTMAKVSMASHMAKPDTQKKIQEMKNDPEFKAMFDDIAKNGPEAMSKYADNEELMSKMSAKMGGLPPGLFGPGSRAAAPRPPPAVEPAEFTTLHEAARWGKTDELKRLIEGGAEVDGKDARGATALGVSVGFDKIDCAKALLASGAKVDETDGKGNTPLHYAAGYGREELAKLLLGSVRLRV